MAITLGIHELWYDTSAALVHDGNVVAAVEEERLSGRKHAPGFAGGGHEPARAIEWCLRSQGLRDRDVDRVAVSVDIAPGRWLQWCAANATSNFQRMTPSVLYRQRIRTEDPSMNVRGYLSGFFLRRRRFLADLHERFGQVHFVAHHLAHAASAWRMSGLAEAGIVVMDGMGERHATTTYHARAGEIRGPLLALGKSHSLGTMYTTATGLLALGAHGEGKTMGLAAYGTPQRAWADLVCIEGDRYDIDWRRMRSLGAFARRKNEEIAPVHQDIAATVQDALERASAAVLRGLHERTGLRVFCLAGGVAMNCTMVRRLSALPFVDRLFVGPASMDMGTALGAALEIDGSWRSEAAGNARWGPTFSEEEIVAAVSDAGLRAERVLDPAGRAAQLLADGNIVGWFDGALEYGARALGGRSILADPRGADVRDIVNARKGRERWRPLAPAVLAERFGDWFEPDSDPPDPFMTRAYVVRRSVRAKIPAVVHVDGTARVQAVDAEHAPNFHRLVRAFERRTGVPVVLNTSLNAAGMPLAATPRDAIETFRVARLDALVLGPYLVRRAQG